jgi:hypothetical protein
MRFVAVIALCVASAAPVFGSQAAQAGRGRGGPVDVNGFKVGDTVEVDTAFGWVDAQIVAVSGSDYQVRVGPNVVRKSYPVELHRKGPFTARDHEVGLYDLKDRVQINIQGQGWVDGVVTTRRALEYEVLFSGNKSIWASGPNIRYVGAPPAPATAKAGAPQKPGFTPCAGTLEGRWGPSNGMPGQSKEIRAGKATLSGPMDDPESFECWTLGTKIILRTPGKPDEDMPMDINKDGTIETPLGELKKKGGVID